MSKDRSTDASRGASTRLRQLVVDSPHSLGARTRASRWQTFREHFPDIEELSVVDLGGTVQSWQRAPVRPASVTVINLLEPGVSDAPWLVPVLGDACNARAALADAGISGKFDLVFSNSLVEHVGGHAKRMELAREVHTLAPRHWVQTPYRYFPVEPHWLFPMMQFLPIRARLTIARKWPLVTSRPATRSDAISEVQWTELIGLTEMRAYFPASVVLRERILGMTKSITAVSAGISR